MFVCVCVRGGGGSGPLCKKMFNNLLINILIPQRTDNWEGGGGGDFFNGTKPDLIFKKPTLQKKKILKGGNFKRIS